MGAGRYGRQEGALSGSGVEGVGGGGGEGGSLKFGSGVWMLCADWGS